LRPYDFTVAVAGRWEAGASERCTDDPLHGLTRSLEAVARAMRSIRTSK
jgi:hypothetical protein